MRKVVFYIFILLLLSGCSAATLAPTITPTVSKLSGKLLFAGSTTLQPLADLIGQAFNKQNPAIHLEIAAGGSAVGIQAVHDGTADIGMASRELTTDELKGIKSYPVALDALAIIVNPSNSIENLTVAQLKDIYNGRIANWKEIGGADLAIKVINRDKNSGTRTAFDDLVLDKKEPAATNAVSAVTAGDVVALLKKEPGAIGYVGFGNLDQTTRLIKINGILPTNQTLKDKTYTLSRPLLLLTGPLSQPLSNSYIDFALSAEGQAIVEKNGWISIHP
jgi:phosphate transport system substrate-binding protein